MLKQKGMTLTESLLAVTIAMMMLVWVGKMQAQAAKDMRSKVTADQYQSLRVIAEQYFKTNRSALISAMDTGASASTWCSLNDVAKKICLVDVSKLISVGAAPSGLKTTTPNSHLLYVSYRLVNPSTGVTEFLIFGATNGSSSVAMSNDEASLAAQFMGENGGIVPAAATGTCATTQACGNGGAWVATLDNFLTGSVSIVQGGVASYGVFI